MFLGYQKSRLNKLYLAHSIQGFAFSLVGIFIPIYLLTLKYSLSQVLIFYIIHYAFLLFFAFFAMRIISRIGPWRAIVLSFPFLFAHLVLLYLLKSIAIPLGVIAFFGGLYSAFYWIPLHLMFVRQVKEEEIGSSTGKLFAFPQLASILAPLLGGFIAAIFGFKILIGIAFLIFSVSFAVYLGSESRGDCFTFRMSEGKKFIKKYPKLFFAEIFDNMGEETEAIIWPIFIYLNLLNLSSVGLVGALLSLGSAVFTLFIGRITDKYRKKQIIKIGVFILLFVWMLRYFANSEIMFYILTVLIGFFTMFFLVPFTSLVYGIAKKDARDEFFVFREVPVAIGRIVILSLALLFVGNIKTMFLFAGVAYLYFLFL